MPCDEYATLVRQRGEGSLPPEQGRLLEDHLPGCDSCRKAVALQRLDDAAVHDALLGFPAKGAAESAGARRYGRLIGVFAIVIALALVGLWALYASVEGAAERERLYRQGAATLDRPVMPRSLRRELPVVLADFSDQVGAPVELAEGTTPPEEVTFVLERRIRLSSALWLLAEHPGVRFRVGEDGVVFPWGPSWDPRNVLPETEKLIDRMRNERVTLSYGGDRLKGALSFIDDLKSLNLLVAPSAAAKVDAAPARLEVRDTPLGEVLDGLLRGTGLRWDVRHEVVVIEIP